jgi:hypothetical protein
MPEKDTPTRQIKAGSLIFWSNSRLKSRALWKPVIRYDCAHDFAHVDRYNRKGETTKEELYLPYDECLTLADEDINLNCGSYKERFLRGEYP